MMIISPVSYYFKKKLIVKQYQHGIFGNLSLRLKGWMGVCRMDVCLESAFAVKFDGLQRYPICQQCFM